MEPPAAFTDTELEEFPELVFEFPPVFPEFSFPPVFEFEEILKLILELLVWFTVQFVELFTFTLLLEPAPFPEITIFIPFTCPEGLGIGEDEGLTEGDALGEELGAGLVEEFGLVDGFTEGLAEALADGEGLGKFAAAVKVLFNAVTESVNKPKTDWLSAKSIKQIKNELKKYVFLICHPRECRDPIRNASLKIA